MSSAAAAWLVDVIKGQLHHPDGSRIYDDPNNHRVVYSSTFVDVAKAGQDTAAGQCAWQEARHNNGWPLIVSTELTPQNYAARTVSNAGGISIYIVKDCENVEQIRQAVTSNPASMYRLKKVDEVLLRIRQRMRIRKVSAEDGMDLKFLLLRECLRYEVKMKRMPFWVCLDWLGSVADLSSSKSTNDRAMAWEVAANGGVKFAEETGIPTLILAQAVNDAQLRRINAAEADRLGASSGRLKGCGGVKTPG